MSYIRFALSRTKTWERATKFNTSPKFKRPLHKIGIFPLKPNKTNSKKNSVLAKSFTRACVNVDRIPTGS